MRSQARIDAGPTRKTYYEVWKPENEFEAGLINDMVAARWRLNRIMMVEELWTRPRHQRS